MMFRSLTDAQLAARHDPTPWASTTGMQSPPARFPEAVEFSEFRPRRGSVPSRDPRPFVDELGDRWVSIFPIPEAGGPDRFDPRPQFARPPVNPILSQWRDAAGSDSDPAELLQMWLDDDPDEWTLDGQMGIATTEAEREHARKVLTRLAALA